MRGALPSHRCRAALVSTMFERHRLSLGSLRADLERREAAIDRP
jgi:hypothetical protein